ncbi:uncharacterized protein PG986_008990 [Apiospora aurea]|uniref:Methyltransferase type 11 domain-containing protein n=1 Tax=Apiospora aurea TaxID=335848 RepID=A0ABR1Q6R7_9PEZI
MGFHQESQSSWNANAAYWDTTIGQEGNKYWKVLQRPTLERLISRGKRPDGSGSSKALELATGNGLGARWLASAEGAASRRAEMLKHAQWRQSDEAAAAKTRYRQVDVTDAAAFDELLAGEPDRVGFDAVLLNMAIMDIADLKPLAKALPKLLKPDGVFVATMLHPVFFTSGFTRSIELKDGKGLDKPEITRAKVIREYLDVPPIHGVAEWGQPTLQIIFHRPIHEIFTTFFREGLVMDAIEEPAFTEADGVKERVEAHSNFTQLPALLAFRLRRSS